MHVLLAIPLLLLAFAHTSVAIVGPPEDVGRTLVYVKVLYNAIAKIDGQEETFNADFYLTAYWYNPNVNENTTDEDVNDKNKFFDPAINFENAREVEARLNEDNQISINAAIRGSITAASRANLPNSEPGKYWCEFNQRYSGDFATPLDLRSFPFDVQYAKIILDSQQWNAEQVEFLPASEDMATQTLPEGFVIGEWTIVEPGVEVFNKTYDIYAQDYSWMSIYIKLRRQPQFYMYRIVAGSILLVYMSVCCFSLEVQEADRMMGTLTCFLSLIAFVFVAGDALPKVAYLTRIDVFSSWSFFLAFIMMVHHAVAYLYRPDEEGDDEGEKKETELKGKGEPAAEKKEDKQEPLNFLGLPTFGSLTGQRKGDLIGVISYVIIYSFSLIIIFERPVADAPLNNY